MDKGAERACGSIHMRDAVTLTEHLADDTLTLPPRLDAEAAVSRILALHGEHGGATFSLYFGDVSGQPLYAVSFYPRRTVTAFNEQALETVLRRFLQQNEDLLSDPRSSVGTWYDAEAEEITVDVTITLGSRAVAEEMGRRYNQIAIFDLKAAEEIATGGSGIERAGWPPEAERLPPLKRGPSNGTDT